MASAKELQEKLEDYQKREIENQKLVERLRKERNEALAHQKLIERNSEVTTPQNVNVCTSIGTMPEYRVSEDWDNYNERLNQYFVANNVTFAERKVAVLITLIGEEAYQALKDICYPVIPAQKSYEELCEILKRQFSKKTSSFKERVEFYDLKQGENESISEWYRRIMKKASSCDFKDHLEVKIKDKFVTGLKKGPVLDRLCEENDDKALKELLDIAIKKETTIQNRMETVHKVKSMQNKSGNKSQNVNTGKDYKSKNVKSEVKCYRCGKTNHEFKKCKHKSTKCNKCNKIGHLAAVCRSECKESEEVKMNWQFEEFNNINHKKEAVIVDILLDGKNFKAEIDSGASISVMPENIYKEQLSKFKLLPDKTVLRFYDDRVLFPLGKVSVPIIKGKEQVEAQFLVTKKGCRILIGRDLMESFGYCVKKINVVQSDNKLKAILDKHKKVFDSTPGCYKYGQIEFKVKEGAKPVFCKPRAVPFAFKKEIERQLEESVKKGFLIPVNDNEWGTPLVPVLKKGGGLRLCADYKVTVNKVVEEVKYPPPTVEESLVNLAGGVKYSKLDMTWAYNQFEVTDETSKLLAISTHKGVFLVKRVPFGVSPAPGEFLKKLGLVFSGLKGVTFFFDDAVVTGKDEEEHLENLDRVLEAIEQAGLKLNADKCQFFQDSIRYLGYVIDAEGLHKDQEKVKAILQVKRPENVTEIQSFIGMINYYGRFVPSLAKLLKPFYELLTGEFKWSKRHDAAFEKVKEEIVSDRVLVHFNPELPIKMCCDASAEGLGAVLLHVFPNGEERPICFASRVLRKAEKGYSVINKEALAIYWGVQKFFQYLIGRKFILCTDHKPLLALFGEQKGIPKMAAGRLQRWALFLSSLDYTIEYVKGSENAAADGLSRLPIQDEYCDEESTDYFNCLVEEKLPINSQDIIRYTRTDPLLSKVYLYVRDGWPRQVDQNLQTFASRADELHLDNGILMWGYRALIPSKVRTPLLEELHAGHIGAMKMKALARQYFWWPNLDKEIEEFTQSCNSCRTFNKQPEKARLIKFQDAEYPFERVHIDFLGPFHQRTYLIVVDAFTKWPEVMEMTRMDSKATIEKLKEIFARYGLPKLLISDNGRQFTSEEFQNFCKVNGIKHRTSAPYHPATNGLAENAVGSFKRGINKALHEVKNRQESMSVLISKYLFAYRNSPHCTTGDSPAQRLYGRNLRNRLDLLKLPRSEVNARRQVEYFRGNREVAFTEGERVLIRDYKNPAKPVWQTGQIEKVLGERTYMCKPDFSESKCSWKRHTDQIKKTGDLYKDNLEEIMEPSQSQSIPQDDMQATNQDESRKEKEEVQIKLETNMRENESSLTVQGSKSDSDKVPITPVTLNVNSRPKRTIKKVQRLNL